MRHIRLFYVLMSPDEIQLLVVLYLLYLSSCFVLPRSKSWLLYSRFKGFKWHLKSTDNAAIFWNRFWLVRPLLPPFGSSYALIAPRCSFGTDGFCNSSPLSTTAGMKGIDSHYLAYSEFKTIEIKEDALCINEVLWWKGSVAELRELQKAIEIVAKSDDKPAAIQHMLRTNLATGALANEQVQTIEKKTEWLSGLCSIYGIWMLLFGPALLFFYPPAWQIWGVGVPLLLLHGLCGVLFFIVHKKNIHLSTYARHEAFWKMILCPPSMIRACDHITSDLIIHGDPAAVMISLTKEENWRPHIQHIIRQLIPRNRPNLETSPANTVAEFSAFYTKALHGFLKQNEIDPASFEVNREHIPTNHRCCPSCETLYCGETTVCHDCGDLPLLSPLSE